MTAHSNFTFHIQHFQLNHEKHFQKTLRLHGFAKTAVPASIDSLGIERHRRARAVFTDVADCPRGYLWR